MMKEVENNSGDGPQVSVVIPAYNMGEYIGDAIESVLQGTLDNFELIVIDDGSTDSTASVVKRYTDPSSELYDSRVRYEWQKNQGKSAAVNFGFTLATGEYVTILDADDEFTSNSLKKRIQMRYSPEGNLCGLVIGGFEVFDREGVHGCRPAPEEKDPDRLRDRFYMRWKTPFSLSACLIRKNLVKQVGGLDESLHRCIDGDYVLRLLEATNNVGTVNDIVYRYRKHRTSPLERVRYRLKTAWYRPQVVWENYSGYHRLAAVPFGLVMDAGKLVYELFDTYKK